MNKQKLFRMLFYLVLASVMFSYMGCTNNPAANVTNNNDSCGSNEIKELDRGSLILTPFPQYTYTLGSERYYIFDVYADSICTDKHVSAEFSAVVDNVAGRPINFLAELQWYILWEKSDTGTVTVTNGGTAREWNARIEDVGLKQQYGENAGRCYTNLHVHFRTLGTQEQDSVFLITHFRACNAKFFYSYHKPSGSISKQIDPKHYKDFPLAQNNKKKKILREVSDESFKDKRSIALIMRNKI